MITSKEAIKNLPKNKDQLLDSTARIALVLLIDKKMGLRGAINLAVGETGFPVKSHVEALIRQVVPQSFFDARKPSFSKKKKAAKSSAPESSKVVKSAPSKKKGVSAYSSYLEEASSSNKQADNTAKKKLAKEKDELSKKAKAANDKNLDTSLNDLINAASTRESRAEAALQYAFSITTKRRKPGTQKMNSSTKIADLIYSSPKLVSIAKKNELKKQEELEAKKKRKATKSKKTPRSVSGNGVKQKRDEKGRFIAK